MKKKSGRRFGVFRSILVLIAFAIVVSAVLILTVYRDDFTTGSVARFFSNIDEQSGALTPGSFEFAGSRENKYASFADGLLVLSRDRLGAYDSLGKEVYNIQTSMQHPSLVTSGDYAISFDRGGQSMIVSNASQELLNKKTEGAIISASINDMGWFCAAVRQSGYKGVVVVFDDKQTERFVWYSTDRYIVDAGISRRSGRLAVACIGQTDGRFLTRLMVLDVNDESNTRYYDMMNTLAVAVRYIGGDRLCVVAEDRVAFFDGDGKFINEADYGGKRLTGYAFGDGFVALMLNRYSTGGRSELLCVDTDGAQLGREQLGENVSNISAAGEYVAVLYGSELDMLDKSLRSQYRFSELSDVREVIAREDGSAVLIGAGQAKVVEKA